MENFSCFFSATLSLNFKWRNFFIKRLQHLKFGTCWMKRWNFQLSWKSIRKRREKQQSYVKLIFGFSRSIFWSIGKALDVSTVAWILWPRLKVWSRLQKIHMKSMPLTTIAWTLVERGFTPLEAIMPWTSPLFSLPTSSLQFNFFLKTCKLEKHGASVKYVSETAKEEKVGDLLN